MTTLPDDTPTRRPTSSPSTTATPMREALPAREATPAPTPTVATVATAANTATVERTERQIAAQLREMERHGDGLAGMAHGFAVLLLAVFSTASLLSLSLAAFTKFQAQMLAGQLDLPDGLNVLLNLLLVVAMDMAMLYAASVIRALINAGGVAREMALHVGVMITASLLETATYIYLVVQFDRPTSAWLWCIGIGRGVAAPLFATYLSLARKLPIAPRDIAYYVSLLAGKGVVHDVAVLAADRASPLPRKVAIYTAAARMAGNDRARFEAIISAVSATPTTPEEPDPHYSHQQPADKRQERPIPLRPASPDHPEPIGPAAPERPEPLPFPAPTPARTGRRGDEGAERPAEAPALAPAAQRPGARPDVRPDARRAPNSRSLTRRMPQPRTPQARTQAPSATRSRPAPDAAALRVGSAGVGESLDEAMVEDRRSLRIRREEVAGRILAEAPDLPLSELARRIAMATHNRISESTARALREAILAEATVEAAEGAQSAPDRISDRPALHLVAVTDGADGASATASSDSDTPGATDAALQQN